MSILPTDLVNYLAASMPQDDVSTSGGAIDLTAKPDIVQFSANAVVAVISDGADTRTVTVTGRLTTGAIATEVITLNGAVEVLGTNTYERVLKAVLSASSGTRTVLLKQGTGGTTRSTLAINDVIKRVLFYDSASGSGITIRYEKLFWKNQHATLSLTNSQLTLTADAAARIRIGGDIALDSTVSVANRLTAPSSVVFVDDSVAQNTPSSGVIAAGSRIGVWIEANLPANDPATKSTFTSQLSGTST